MIGDVSDMKMVMAIINKNDEDFTVEALNKEGFFVTKLATTGGFLKKTNSTLLIVTEDEKVAAVENIIKEEAGKRKEKYPITTPTANALSSSFVTAERDTGGATIFVLEVEKTDKF